MEAERSQDTQAGGLRTRRGWERVSGSVRQVGRELPEEEGAQGGCRVFGNSRGAGQPPSGKGWGPGVGQAAQEGSWAVLAERPALVLMRRETTASDRHRTSGAAGKAEKTCPTCAASPVGEPGRPPSGAEGPCGPAVHGLPALGRTERRQQTQAPT